MTMTRTDWVKDDVTPPRTNSEVASVMSELKVGRRRAYEIIRQRTAAEMNIEGVDQGQRLAVMACLIAHPDTGRDSDLIRAALREVGVGLDIHDVNKTLWALAKTNFVRFRKRSNPRRIYAIKMTPQGIEAYHAAVRNGREAADNREASRVAAEILREQRIRENAVAAVVEAVASVALDHDPEVQTITTEEAREMEGLTQTEAWQMLAEEVPAPTPAATLNINISDWPALYALRERARRAAKVNAAIRLLEEAGEDEVALTLMGKVEFNQLEQEVVRLLNAMGENIE